MKRLLKMAALGMGGGIAAAGLAYAGVAAWTWLRYGDSDHSSGDTGTLDTLFPDCDIREKLHLQVAAPSEAVFRAACALRLRQIPAIQTVFRTRERVLRAEPSPEADLPLVEQAQTWGWGILSETPGREIIFGAVTQPWAPNPVFHAVAPEAFAGFRQPGFVKIAWTLRAEPGTQSTRLITETRAIATDMATRNHFRNYWAMVMPGTYLIRWLALRAVRKQMEDSHSSLRSASQVESQFLL